MKKLLPLLLALCLTLSACAAPAAVPLPGDPVTAVTVTYAGKTVTCTDPAQVRAMTDAARSLEFVPTDASVTTPGAMSMELTFTDSSGSAVTLTLTVDGKSVTTPAVLANGSYYLPASFYGTLGVTPAA